MDPDIRLKARMRSELPTAVFARRPRRALLVVPLVAVPVAGAMVLHSWSVPWYGALPIALAIGHCYAALMLLGHEIGHGATVGSRRLQDLLLYPCLAAFLISPSLWRIWHNRAHHAHTNDIDHDPDGFGDMASFDESRPGVRFLARLGPGSGHWLSAFYLLFALTVHGLNVLLRKSKRPGEFEQLDRRRAMLETAGLGTFWAALGVMLGPVGALYVIVVPMLAANVVVNAYFITNHTLRPLTRRRDSLGTALDVRTFKLLDHLHFHTSHHAEHHLFPRMCSSQLPAVRAWLHEHAGEHFIVVPHWQAIRHAYRWPKVYLDETTLVEPFSGRRVDIATIESELARARG